MDISIARTVLVVVLVVHLALGLVYNVVTPIFEAPDEIWHYLYVRHVAEGKGLPVQAVRHSNLLAQQEAGQPPLYYVAAAALTFWAPRGDLQTIVRANPQASIGDPTTDGNKNRFVHGSAEELPWEGEVWAIHLARLVSTLFGSATVLLTYLIGRELWPKRPDLAVGAAAVNALIPQFLFIGAAVNNDVAAAATSSLVLLLSVRLAQRGPTARRLAWTSLALALAILTKFGGPAAIALPVGALAWWHWRHAARTAWLWPLVRSGALLIAPVAALTGWWYARNLVLYGELIPLKVFLNIADLEGRAPTVAEVLRDLPGLWLSLWAVFGWFSVLASPGVYTFYSALALVAVAGLAVAIVRHRRGEPILSVPLLLAPLWLIVVVVALLRYRMIVLAFQGRLLFPAISALALLLYLGLAAWVPWRWRWVGLVAVVSPLIAIAAALPFQTIAPAYARPPVLTRTTIGTPVYPSNAHFDDGLELLGYDLGADTLRPGETLALTLYWHAPSRMEADYVVFVHLRDWQGKVLAQYDSFPARGSFATSLWSPGDALRDTVRLPIPADVETPTRAQLFVGLEEAWTGRRLTPTIANEPVAGDAVPLGFVRIVGPPPAAIPNPRDDVFGGWLALDGFALERSEVRPGEVVRGRLYLRSIAPVDRDYTVFVHLTRDPLVDAASIVAQEDRQPYDGAYPTTVWRAGEVLTHDFVLTVPPETPPGDYVVRVGFYDLATGRRLPVGDGDHVRLAVVTVQQ